MLLDFWENKYTADTFANTIFFETFWNALKLNPFFGNISTLESARRYWSWIQLAAIPLLFGGGTPNLYWPNYEYDTKFLNFIEFPHGISYDYTPLKRLLSQSINFPIKTNPTKKNQPRLLLVSVDLKNCSSAVTFDSYYNVGKKCEICTGENIFKDNQELTKHLKDKHSINTDTDGHVWYSLYGGEKEQDQHIVFYNGINLEQVTAGSLIPQSIDHPTMIDVKSNKERIFWDGGLLSNTPIRELLHHHRKYWMDYYDLKKENDDDNNYDYLDSNNKTKKRVPDLEIYVVNLYPAIEKDDIIPSYKDQILDRSNDIRFHDRTVYDIKSARMVSDYIDLSYKLIDFALNIGKDDNKGILTKLKNEIFNREVDQSHHRMGGMRKYKDLLIGRFEVQRCKIY